MSQLEANKLSEISPVSPTEGLSLNESFSSATSKVVSRREADKNIPEGMSKSQWKKLQKRKRFDDMKQQFQEVKRAKRQQSRANRRIRNEELRAKGIDPSTVTGGPPKARVIDPEDQIPTDSSVIIDCAFDDLMLEKEIVSLSNQITRIYSDARRSKYAVGLVVTSFGDRLESRFDDALSQYKSWKTGINFSKDSLKDYLESQPYVKDDLSNVVYLSADTDDKLEKLSKDEVYIIGGIVDKGRHKNLCQNKAQEMRIQTKRLPIDEYIKLSGRKVLATSHVFELLLKWWEFKDWKKAFEAVIPQHKLIEEKSRED